MEAVETVGRSPAGSILLVCSWPICCNPHAVLKWWCIPRLVFKYWFCLSENRVHPPKQRPRILLRVKMDTNWRYSILYYTIAIYSHFLTHHDTPKYQILACYRGVNPWHPIPIWKWYPQFQGAEGGSSVSISRVGSWSTGPEDFGLE